MRNDTVRRGSCNRLSLESVLIGCSSCNHINASAERHHSVQQLKTSPANTKTKHQNKRCSLSLFQISIILRYIPAGTIALSRNATPVSILPDSKKTFCSCRIHEHSKNFSCKSYDDSCWISHRVLVKIHGFLRFLNLL